MIILVKLVVGNLVLNVTSAYTPQVGLDVSAKKQFVEDLENACRQAISFLLEKISMEMCVQLT
jgi:hypothetical protein